MSDAVAEERRGEGRASEEATHGAEKETGEDG